MSWKPPELPKMEKMPEPRAPAGPSAGGRVVAGLAAVALGFTSMLGLYGSFRQQGPGASPFGSLALLIPTAVLARYALTGRIKLQ